jgi:hypothetical protein
MTAAVATDEQLHELLELIKGSDSVELKLTVPESGHRSAIRALEMDPIEAQIRQVFFFDTPDLALYRHGLVVRARRIQGKGADSVVKLRPVVPANLSPKLRRSPGFGVELDAMPGGFVCSASMKGKTDAGLVREATVGQRPLRKVFSSAQAKFYGAHAPEGLELDDLAVLGPIFVLKLRFSPAGLGRRLVAELWLYPDNSWILELSTKCPPHDAFLRAAELRAFLTQRGLDLSAEQQTKTRRALEYFGAQADGAEA